MLSTHQVNAVHASGSPYKDMLHTVTTMKLDEIKVQQARMLAHYKTVKDSAASTNKLTEKLRILFDGMVDFTIAGTNVHEHMVNIEALIKQAETDPTISKSLLQYWIKHLTTEITRCEKRWEFAHLFGGLLTEYLNYENAVTSDTGSWMNVDTDDGKSVEVSEYAPESKDSAKAEYERSFKAEVVDIDALKQFVNTELLNFDTTPKENGALSRWNQACAQLKTFAEHSINHKVTQEEVVLAVTSLLKNDLLSLEKREILRDLQSNETILNEFAAILTLMLDKVNNGEWTWPSSGVFGDVRPAVGGRHRVFLDYDICTMIFLEYIGLQWCIQFRTEMTNLLKYTPSQFASEKIDTVWNKAGTYSGKKQEAIQDQRFVRFLDDYFLNMLPASAGDVTDTPGMYDDLRGENEDKISSLPMQKLMLLIATEAKWHQAVYKDKPFTVVKTDLASFGLSLNHDVVLAVLEVFQLPPTWLKFFRTYLEAPITISGQTRTCKQGTHIAHLISRLMGEAVLTLMDLYVNRQTGTEKLGGVLLHRIHDDIWFWTREEETAIRAWESMNKFARLFGVSFNLGKSGSVSIYHPTTLLGIKSLTMTEHKITAGTVKVIPGSTPLPQLSCEWGFLILGSDGHFHVSTRKLLFYAEIMRQMLRACKSVIIWVNVFNKFTSFFLRNFGRMSPVFGLKHIDEIMAALKTVYSVAFKDAVFAMAEDESEFPNPISVVEVMIKERFPSLSNEKIPDAWFHWPITAGGLGLENPFINLMASRKSVEDKTAKMYGRDLRLNSTIPVAETYFYLLENSDKVKYESEKSDWDAEQRTCVRETKDSAKPHVFVEFKSFAEWAAHHRETRRGTVWAQRFYDLVDNSDLKPAEPESTPELDDLINKFIARGKKLTDPGTRSNDVYDDDELSRGLKPYWRWVLCYYGPALMEAFGSLEFMNTELIPMGMIGNLKRRSTWD
ncbi:hypothetical protein HDU79_004911 [Rhizoclosmatium sp. JEL0117]|nr:hypothetical protein HDU79_004911 [Rhizoclosmatium sp. JEL0117]